MNDLVYNFEWGEIGKNYGQVEQLLNNIASVLDVIDFKKYPRLPESSFGEGSALPLKGIVYEDLLNTLLNIFAIGYMATQGRDVNGNPDTALTQDIIGNWRFYSMNKLTACISKIIRLDGSLQARVEALQS